MRVTEAIVGSSGEINEKIVMSEGSEEAPIEPNEPKNAGEKKK